MAHVDRCQEETTVTQGPIWGCAHGFEWTATRTEKPGWSVIVTPTRADRGQHPRALRISETLSETKLRERVTQILAGEQ